ncbi:DUF1934 domain-containing protein [Brevibacillus fulvus]|uniref:Uncharacterized beta-barrel protein YwiB (DUF1934 family) n=1 Tax=Brevibacillus fulvus TaxID=1125967 RepID=A0A938XZ04_9BACL|nr:DUF1934 domain-containing protein [Brevibacillus fulvus]MBM7590218.1 uncharacterized beta-barrel protein YwiB (DUF1934 family) [Brevibacillus fulvus]
MQDVQIQLAVTHQANGQTEQTRYSYQGRGTKKENGWYFSYPESLEGVGTIQTVLKVGEADVTLLRQGKLQMKQLFAKGKTSETIYNSPMGPLTMETHTRKVKIKREADRPAQLLLAYQVWLNGQYAGDYELHLLFQWQ